MYLGVGPLRLEQLVTRVLINLRDYIGDIGDTPVTLLTPVLEQCNAAQLAFIEDDTRYSPYQPLTSFRCVSPDMLSQPSAVQCRQGGRDIHNDLAVHWLRCYRTDFGGSPVRRFSQVPRADAYPQLLSWALAWLHLLHCQKGCFPDVFLLAGRPFLVEQWQRTSRCAGPSRCGPGPTSGRCSFLCLCVFKGLCVRCTGLCVLCVCLSVRLCVETKRRSRQHITMSFGSGWV
jgi:hypothetical protein